jgi:hypothetical protein
LKGSATGKVAPFQIYNRPHTFRVDIPKAGEEIGEEKPKGDAFSF